MAISMNPNCGLLKLIPLKPKWLKSLQLFAKENKSLADIARYMAKLGITKKNGQPIRINQVKFMLTSRFYNGILEFAGEYYQGSHKTFINKKLFDEVQKQMNRISKPRKGGHNFAFYWNDQCGECGASITAEEHTKFYKTTNHQATYVYYRCTKRSNLVPNNPFLNKNWKFKSEKIMTDAALPGRLGQ